jgi:hypothetical protein
MQEYCHRCGGELSGDTHFCPHCGAPQLTLALEQQSIEAGGERPDGTPANSTGALPPPAPRSIDWRVAIRYAAGVAAIGAMLSLAAVRVDILSLPSLLWLVSASMITLGLYQKRLPAARIDAGIGARIGVMVGLCLALGLAASMAGWGLVDRYALHGMGSFDAQMMAQMAQAQQQLQQRATAQKTPIPPELMGLVRSPEFRATAMLAGYAMLAAVLMVVSAVGGAFGGMLRMKRPLTR